MPKLSNKARKPKAAEAVEAAPYTVREPTEGRRYGPELDAQTQEEVAPGIRGLNLPAMNEAQIRQFAMQNYGRRFAENETREAMTRTVMADMDVGPGARYA